MKAMQEIGFFGACTSAWLAWDIHSAVAMVVAVFVMCLNVALWLVVHYEARLDKL